METNNSHSKEQVQAKDSASPGGSVAKERNDNSNPQQGTGGSRPLVPYARTKYGRPSLKIPPSVKDSRKLFVGGLPPNVTSEEFDSFFRQFGPVMDSVVLIDRSTNRSRGFGFVTYEDEASAKKVLSSGYPKDNCPENPTRACLEMQGKQIEVKCAEPKESCRRNQFRVSAANEVQEAAAVAFPAPLGAAAEYYYPATEGPVPALAGAAAEYYYPDQQQYYYYPPFYPAEMPPVFTGCTVPMYYPGTIPHPPTEMNFGYPYFVPPQPCYPPGTVMTYLPPPNVGMMSSPVDAANVPPTTEPNTDLAS